MLARLGSEVFGELEPHEVLYRDLSQELVMFDGTAELRLTIPFVEKAEIKLKKVGLELIVRVGGHKRNIILPTALASFKPREARFEAETLLVRFEKEGQKQAGHEQAHDRVGGGTNAA
jgi:arsenite/tail-anchored protein-transporting ATPase